MVDVTVTVNPLPTTWTWTTISCQWLFPFLFVTTGQVQVFFSFGICMAYTLNETNRLGQLTTSTLLPPTHLKCNLCKLPNVEIRPKGHTLGRINRNIWQILSCSLLKYSLQKLQVVSYTHWMLVSVNSGQISSKKLYYHALMTGFMNPELKWQLSTVVVCSLHVSPLCLNLLHTTAEWIDSEAQLTIDEDKDPETILINLNP